MAKLYFRYGAMGCGKTRDIVKVAHNYEDKEKSIIIMKPARDTKGDDKIKSRDGSERKVDYLIKANDNIFLIISMYILKNNLDCILIDEAQFLSWNQVEELTEIVDRLDIPVICYGLKTDFQGKLFEGSAALFASADEFEKMKTICNCGAGAECNIRLINGKAVFEGDQIAIDGDKEIKYESMCRKCRKKLYKEWKGRNKNGF